MSKCITSYMNENIQFPCEFDKNTRSYHRKFLSGMHIFWVIEGLISSNKSVGIILQIQNFRKISKEISEKSLICPKSKHSSDTLDFKSLSLLSEMQTDIVSFDRSVHSQSVQKIKNCIKYTSYQQSAYLHVIAEWVYLRT